jgi:hypothetical protein
MDGRRPHIGGSAGSAFVTGLQNEKFGGIEGQLFRVNLRESHKTTAVPEDETMHVMAVCEELQGGDRRGAVDSAEMFVGAQVLLADV